MLLNDTIIRKKRTEGTSAMILELVQGVKLESLLSDLFIHTEDTFGKELIRKFEFQLISAVEAPAEFAKGLHLFYTDTARFIKKNNAYQEFYSFCYFVFSTLSVKKNQVEKSGSFNKALNCYYNLLFQQMNYFVPHPKLAYGISTKGTLLLRDEPFPNIDVAMMIAGDDKNIRSIQDVYKLLHKYGYNINTELEFMGYQKNDQILTNMTLIMSYFINENTIHIKPERFHMVAHGINTIKMTNPTDSYIEALREKRYFLPIKGITGRYENCADIKEVFFQEVFTDNRIVLLYKATTIKGREFCGFYDTKLELFYSPWDDTDQKKYHHQVENFILESYCYLTTEMDEEIKELGLKKRLYYKHQVPIISTLKQPTVEFFVEEMEEETTRKDKRKKRTGTFRMFDKRNYQDSKISIGPATRRLPRGAKASEEAIKLAREYHYVLHEGETFVRPFERTTYRKED